MSDDTSLPATPSPALPPNPRQAPAPSANFGVLDTGLFNQAMQLADTLSQSTLVPKEYQGNPGNVMVAIQLGMEVGLAPMQAMQTIGVINGRPTIYGDGLVALVMGSGLCDYINETWDEKSQAATCVVRRKGMEEISQTFSMADAKLAGLTGKTGPWKLYPARMCKMRARSWALRDGFADVLKGMSTLQLADELEEKDVTPKKRSYRRPSRKTEPVPAERNWREEAGTLSETIMSLCSHKDLAELRPAVMQFPNSFQQQLIDTWNKRYREIEKEEAAVGTLTPP